MAKPKLGTMAWRNLWRNRRRTLITLFSIVFGVFLAVMFTGLQDRTWSDTINMAARLGGGHVSLQHPEYHDTPSLTRTVQHATDLARLALEHPGVTRAVPRITGQTMLATAGESFGASFMAIDIAAEDASTLSLLDSIEQGGLPEDGKIAGILIGKQLAINLGAAIGDRVVYTMTDKQGEIVSGLARLSGIIHTGSSGVDNGLAVLPIERVRKVLNYDADEASQVAVFVANERASEAVAAELGERLDTAVVALPWNKAQPDLASFIAMKSGGAIAMEIFIAVLVAAGIFNTLFVTVMERLREFGIMLAVGFSPGSLFRLVMLESLWLGLVGLAGAAAVTIGPYWYLASTGLDISGRVSADGADIAGVKIPSTLQVGIFPESVVAIACLALLATLLAGIYPAWKAGRVNPVDTIRLV